MLPLKGWISNWYGKYSGARDQNCYSAYISTPTKRIGRSNSEWLCQGKYGKRIRSMFCSRWDTTKIIRHHSVPELGRKFTKFKSLFKKTSKILLEGMSRIIYIEKWYNWAEKFTHDIEMDEKLFVSLNYYA